MNEVKTVGVRRSLSPEESLAEVFKLQRVANKLTLKKRPRGMVFKAKTWEEKERFEKELRKP